MGTEDCSAYRREISDVLGRREALGAACAAHVASCAECSGFAGLVAALAAGPGTITENPAPEWQAADEALRKASRIMARRREVRQFALFLCLATAAMSAWTWAGRSGKGGTLLALQALAFLVLPFAGLVALVGQRKGGSA